MQFLEVNEQLSSCVKNLCSRLFDLIFQRIKSARNSYEGGPKPTITYCLHVICEIRNVCFWRDSSHSVQRPPHSLDF